MNSLVFRDKEKGKTVSYARYLMEKHLGRELTDNEIVFHLDGNKFNNDISNLIIREKRNSANKACEICGITSKEKRLRYCYNVWLCSKHYMQMWRNGTITDTTSNTIQDEQEYIRHEDFTEIVVLNKAKEIINKIIIDNDDIEKLKRYKWTLDSDNYAISKDGRKTIRMNRYIMNYSGPMFVDHINRNVLDNRKENLRIVLPVTNSQNIRRVKPKEIKPGVWQAQITRFRKHYYLGRFKSKELAEKAIDDFYNQFYLEEKDLLEQYILNDKDKKT